jgi:hypothetical protein
MAAYNIDFVKKGDILLHIRKFLLYPVNSFDVDPPFLHVDPPGKRAVIVRANDA